jgi:hypothetical protein
MVRSIQGSRLPLALVASALVALAAWAAIVGVAHAVNAVSVDSATVEPDASGSVNVNAEAPGNGLGAWNIDVVYDPEVITVDSCDEGSVGLNLCSVDQVADNTVRVVGADAGGAEGDLVMATINFTAVGADGDCTDLTVTVNQFADPDSEETDPSVSDGEICIAAATPTPTPVPATPTPTTAASPTPAPSALPDTGGSADDGSSSSNMAAILLGILGLAVVGSGVFAVSKIRGQA